MKGVVKLQEGPPAARTEAEPQLELLGGHHQADMYQMQQDQQLEQQRQRQLLSKVQKQPSEKQLQLVRLSPVAEQSAGKTGPVRVDLPNGERHVSFADGSEYYGEWHDGTMHGRGIFFWPNGDAYEGGWKDGLEHGVGTFIAADGSTYYGAWKGGQLDGQGVYKPAAAGNRRAEVVFMREYKGGALLSEQVLRVAEKDVRKKRKEKKKAKKQAKREYQPPKPGERIYKGHGSYQLMRELQLGITFSIAQAGQEAAESGSHVLDSDFHAKLQQYFPRSSETGPFKWKDYSPVPFHRLRQTFGIDNRDYLLSITGGAALRELASPGKSGSVFFLSDDDRFIIKTVRHGEMRLLLDLIPRYYRHVQANPGTLLVHFYGVHRISPPLGHRVRFIVMGNVLPTDRRLHRKYDLKGSTWRRTVGPERRETDAHATLKDQDLDMQLVLSPEVHMRVMRQLERDCALLEELGVMDYSLLLGVHFQRWGNFRWSPPFKPWVDKPALVDAELSKQQQQPGKEDSAREVEAGARRAVAEAAGGHAVSFSAPSMVLPQQQDARLGEVDGRPLELKSRQSREALPGGGSPRLQALATAAEPSNGAAAAKPRPPTPLEQRRPGLAAASAAVASSAASESGPAAANDEAAVREGSLASLAAPSSSSLLESPSKERWLHRTASEGMRSLLSMLHQAAPADGEDGGSGSFSGRGQPSRKLVQAAQSVLHSAQLEGRAARQVAALASAAPNISPSASAASLGGPGSALSSQVLPSPTSRGALAGPSVSSELPGGEGEERLPSPCGTPPRLTQPSRTVSQRRQGSDASLSSSDSEVEQQRAAGTDQAQPADDTNELCRRQHRKQAQRQGQQLGEGASLPAVLPAADVYPTVDCSSGERAGLAEGPEGGQACSATCPGRQDGGKACVHGGCWAGAEQPAFTPNSSFTTPDSPRSCLGLDTRQQQEDEQAGVHAHPRQLPSTVRGRQQQLPHAPGGWVCGIPIAGWFCASSPAVLHEGGPSSLHWEPTGLSAKSAAQLSHPRLSETVSSVPALQPPVSRSTSSVTGAAAAAALERSRGSGLLRALSLQASGGPASCVGQAVPAVAVRRDGGESQPVLLFFGIIDFLQEYTVLKRAEHSWKALVQDGASVSVTDPRAYRKRFLATMRELFVVDPALAR
ncbi:hypothetical protein N2152v2_000538 [Parachlorella kessleri]